MELRNLEEGSWLDSPAPSPRAGVLDKPVSHFQPQHPNTASGLHLSFGGCPIFGTQFLQSWGERCSWGVHTCNSLFSPHSKPLGTGILGKREPSPWVTSLGTRGEPGCHKQLTKASHSDVKRTSFVGVVSFFGVIVHLMKCVVTLPTLGRAGSPGLLNPSSEGTQNPGIAPKMLSAVLSRLLVALPAGDTGMSQEQQDGHCWAQQGRSQLQGGAAAQTQAHSWHSCFSPVHKQSPGLEKGCEPRFLPQPHVLTPGRCPLIPTATGTVTCGDSGGVGRCQ